MDDHERLFRLLLMTMEQVTEWYQPVAERQLAEVDRQVRGESSGTNPLEDKTSAEAAGNRLSTMTRYVELADLWHRSGGTQGSHQDYYELPGFVLEAVTGVPDDMMVLLGTWTQEALGLGQADPREVGQLWIEDVKATAWRLLIEHGAWPGQHTDKREPLDLT